MSEAKAKNAEAGAKLTCVKELDVLHAKRREVASKIKDIEEAAGDAWAGVKVTTDEAWRSIRGARLKSFQRSG
ncbi:MAG: hypothetical protein IT488_13525 [Gammaproteobacteria bacterium]|nr:hypothetical protein [Gammaproteobacteria bacterium]